VTSWDELEVGSEYPPFVDEPLSVTDFVRYQGASGDMNPIHHDDTVARAAGYPSVFAVGMLGAGILAAYATDWLGPENIRYFKVRFGEQAWPGDVITYTGRVSAKRIVGDQSLIDVELAAIRQTGGVHIRGYATFLVPRSP
jgi:acyl dehydratase